MFCFSGFRWFQGEEPGLGRFIDTGLWRHDFPPACWEKQIQDDLFSFVSDVYSFYFIKPRDCMQT